MALTDILSEAGESSVAARGNVGTLVDILARDGMSHYRFLSVPAVGDVEASVLYGKQGVELTGTLQQPSPTNVKLGVQYGAGGTEFTGTLEGGSGSGSTWMRAR
jgi:hypothetical protein